MRRFLKLGMALVAAGWIVALGVAWSTPYWFARKTTDSVDARDTALVERGRYLARAADCVACHSAPGGREFAGGLAMQTPMGTIYSTNITPDKETGIGGYDYGDFERAVRKGIRPDGTPLYPAMPYVSYRVVGDDDIKALYAFFASEIPAVRQENRPTTIPWPLSMRWPLAWWQLLFGGHRTFDPPTGADESVIRGAYLVEGLAHCGACHTPRGIAFQEKAVKETPSGDFLSGSVLEGWFAKNLRNQATGLSTWNKDEIVDFLKTGRTARTAAFGSMVDVVQHSTQHLDGGDLTAIADFLKSLAPRSGREAKAVSSPDLTTGRLQAGDYSMPGALTYAENCATCHRLDGRGAPRIFPALAGNSIVFAEDPSSLIQITLAGGTMAKTPADRMAFAMPAFDRLDNHEIADLLTFIRSGWGNKGSAVTGDDVGAMRAILARKPKNDVPGDAR